MSGGTLVDLLTLDEAKQAIGKGVLDETQTDLLAIFNTAVSVKLADMVGPIIYATITAEVHDGGGNALYLNQSPIQGVVSVVEYDSTSAATLTAETNASKPDSGYAVNIVNGKLSRRSGNATGRFPIGVGNLLVTYVAGRYTQTSTVGDTYKAAAALVLKNAWRAYENAVALQGEFDIPQAAFPSFIMPNAAKSLLGKQWRAESGIGD